MSTTMSALAILLFLPVICTATTDESPQYIGENDTDGDGETTEAPTTPHPCHCTLMTYGADEMEGTLKSPRYPDNYCNDQQCLYEIEPNAQYSILLKVRSMQMEVDYDRLNLFYYAYINIKREKIHLINMANRDFLIYTAPPGIGFFLNMSTDGSRSGRFLLEYERVDASNGIPGTDKMGCPYPFLQANQSVQTISFSKWINTVCGLRISSNNSIMLTSKCSPFTYSNIVQFVAKLPGQTSEYWSFTTYDSYTRETTTADVTIKGTLSFLGRKLIDSCEMSVISLDYNPCNCSTTEYSLGLKQQLNISSPGYPQMFCKDIACVYTIKRDNSTEQRKNGFIITAFHQSKHPVDSLRFQVDGSDVMRMQKTPFVSMDARETKEMVFVGDSLQVYYRASSVMSDMHGFTLSVKTIDVSPSCMCPTNAVKPLPTAGSYSLTIPSDCPDMHCRFSIPVPPAVITVRRLLSNPEPQNFRMKVSYQFPHEREQLTVETRGLATVYAGDSRALVNRKYNLFTGEDVNIFYRREGIESDDVRIGDSVFNLTWKWMKSSDCSCDQEILPAVPDEWEELYSPRYPDEYCGEMSCIYKVQAPVGYTIVLNITFFQTEPHSDYLFIFDGFNTSSKHALQLSGHVLHTPLFESMGRNVSLWFTSDASVSAKGFVIAYKAKMDESLPLDGQGGGHGLLIGVLVAISLLVGVGGYIVYNNKEKIPQPFRNPVFIPSIRYSASDETITAEPDPFAN